MKLFFIVIVVGFIVGLISNIVAFFMERKYKSNVKDKIKKDIN